MRVTTIGLDLAKNIFHVHGIAADGTVVVALTKLACLRQYDHSRFISQATALCRQAGF